MDALDVLVLLVVSLPLQYKVSLSKSITLSQGHTLGQASTSKLFVRQDAACIFGS